MKKALQEITEASCLKLGPEISDRLNPENSDSINSATLVENKMDGGSSNKKTILDLNEVRKYLM